MLALHEQWCQELGQTIKYITVKKLKVFRSQSLKIETQKFVFVGLVPGRVGGTKQYPYALH